MIEATVISKSIDPKRGSIIVWTQYKVDGKEVASAYPKIDGKSVYCVRYDPLQLLGKTEAEIEAKVLKDLEAHTGKLIKDKFKSLTTSDILDTGLANIIGKTITKGVTVVRMGDRELTLKDDGTYTSKTIVPTEQ